MNSRRAAVVLVAAAALAATAVAQAPSPRRRATTPAPPVAAGTEALVETPLGSFAIRLLPEIAPGHAAHFVEVARKGGYDGTTFHRIIAGGIIQGGDPLSKDPARAAEYGRGGLGLLKAELSDRPFTRGTVAAVRRPSSLDSGGTQFFVCLSDQPALRGQYTIFGEIVSGMDVVDRIGRTPVEGDRAKERVPMKVEIREAAAAAP